MWDGLVLSIFVLAFGFVLAGTSDALWRAIGEPPGVRFPLDARWKVVSAFVVCAVTGPYLVARGSLIVWRTRGGSNWLAAFGLALSMIWSYCSGFFAIQFVLLARSGFASVS